MKYVVLLLAMSLSFPLFGQKLISRSGHVWFFSSTPAEDIEAHTYQAASIINTESGEIACQMLLKGFQFEKALMQEHFNEKYVESDQYPNAVFKGQIENFEGLDWSKGGTFDVKFVGEITLHGVTKPVSVPGTLTVSDEAITAKAKFGIKPADHEIKIPSVVTEKIAEVIDVNLDIMFKRG